MAHEKTAGKMEAEMSESIKRPKAIGEEGKIGRVSCYVLDDGRCVLSKRTILTELQPGASGSGDLDQYLERLAKRSEGLALPAVFEFVLPGGGVAEAITDEDFMGIVEAYVDGLVLGKLHPQQVPVAQRVYELQKTWAQIGLRSHILAVTGQIPTTVVQQIRCFADRLFRRAPRDWEKRFDNEFVEAVCDVYGWRPQGRRIPRQMAAVFDKLYRVMMGNDGKAALKKRNPDPRNGPTRHHQHLSDELDGALKAATFGITYLARRSGRNIEHFWRQVEEMFGIVSTQTELPLTEPR